MPTEISIVDENRRLHSEPFGYECNRDLSPTETMDYQLEARMTSGLPTTQKVRNSHNQFPDLSTRIGESIRPLARFRTFRKGGSRRSCG
jgi:hypothetical protein